MASNKISAFLFAALIFFVSFLHQGKKESKLSLKTKMPYELKALSRVN